ncbi:hypothetical protein AD45P2_00505 [Alteromonas phage vB_AmaP_AD45-P2]|uniref:Uncharacterized protein n=2 Tax=Pseudomonadota TaxID=1224 RepID=A0A922P2X5_9HYPH|nr:hypothetical protein [Pseudorhizobium pelagicum]YP_008126071.1 DNA primase [Alteromonas phage vB_AmaP_AD45-P1]AGM47150.1 hypothetical protein AD45P4_00475 [Alteromonas phage vB_AmaP_AD45-P4]AGM47272.1 hypothetical protein AD45P2_00505 [Alteromonas phage vB_AmaP_AD45-P2]AGM46918.1 hypothetical protein AD45P1_00500 [Alteromonas phage vB_AmaP_AD45-P1]KEQ05609.1 hypothetical protein GV68_08755 [Pseudorhizobium pelagicum]
MSMLTQTKELLTKEGAFSGEQNKHLQSVIEAISFPTIDPKMKAVIAVSQITSFASQFRRNIKLWDDHTEVPINAISFVITGSGAGKDSSVKAARKCFTSGYKVLEGKAMEAAVKEAIAQAKEEGLPNPQDEAIYKPYLKPVPPVDIMPTTGPGLIQHINDIGDVGVGAGIMYSGEFSDELAYNQDMVENIKTLSEIYDTGDKEVKYTKSAEFRSKAIAGQPVSALFVGSPGHILYDEGTKKKFHIAFMSKLARRSWFCYAADKIEEQVFDTLEEFWEYEEEIETRSKHARLAMDTLVKEIAKYHAKHIGKEIAVSKSVERLYKTYKRYNNDLADLLPNQDSTYALIRRHLQWKALKLAGAFAIMEKEDEVTPEHYIEAIRFCEILDKDMEEFERDLNKAPHELLVDFFHTKTLVDGKSEISTHDLKKQGFMNNVSNTKLKEMVALCAGYDQNSVYSVINDGSAIHYEPIVKTDVINVTYKEIDTSQLNAAVESGDFNAIRQAKHNIASTTNYGFEAADTSFDELPQLLAGDYAFSPYRFKDGVRRKENLESGTKWVVLDIDDSPLSAEEAHFMLGDINHHIALTSDKDNNFKFRVLLELDSEVYLDPAAWKHFYLKIADDLGLRADPLPQSQIFYSYAGRDVYSNTESSPLPTRDYLMYAKDMATDKETAGRVMTNAQRRAQLNDPTTTFEYAFEAKFGEGSRSMYRMMRHAQDLGADLDEVLQLLEDVNDYWESPMPEERLEKLRDQGRRLF